MEKSKINSSFEVEETRTPPPKHMQMNAQPPDQLHGFDILQTKIIYVCIIVFFFVISTYLSPHLFFFFRNPCAPKASFSCSMPRPPNRNRRRNSNSATTTTTKPAFYTSYFENFQATFDLNSVYHSSHSYLRHFLGSAPDDLQTLVFVDVDCRIVVSCHPSTLRYIGNFVVLTCAVVLGFRVLVGLVKLGFGNGSAYEKEKVVTRRDRSLGGKEVVVARIEKPRAEQVRVKKNRGLGILDNHLSSVRKSSMVARMERVFKNRVHFGEKLPQ